MLLTPALGDEHPAAFGLPNPLHLRRLPQGLSALQWQRLRQAAYHLPQVLSPTENCTEAFERAGLIQIQKAISGNRSSRWIEPALIPLALAHLDALGSLAHPRVLMQQREAQLHGLGLHRDGLRWKRLCQQGLQLSRPGWRVVLAHVTEADEAAIWTFFRDGDLAQLEGSLGEPPAWPQAEVLLLHLESLLTRSLSGHEAQIESLLPALQAECAVPQTLDALLAACTRAQDRWEQRAAESETLARLNTELAFRAYPESFALARRLQRSVTLYVGAPNSGKTHAAFERLTQAQAGAYLAPLRLLALEGRDRLVARGIPCSLLTGEERVLDERAQLVSSTIEMIDIHRPLDVAVIDEAQMLFDANRGWAWTQAILGAPADELIVICSEHAVPAIERLLGLAGERCSVQRFERKQQVQLMPAALPLGALRKGDAVIAFSRREVLMLRDQIAASGHAVALIYGALPPEVRRREAERFASGEAELLVATDAIGMGLNLPIRRVLFSSLSKFDGLGDRPLSAAEAQQIAGRAGRFGLHEEGFAGVLREAGPGAVHRLEALLDEQVRAPSAFKAAVAPAWWHLQAIADQLGLQSLGAVLGVFMQRLRLDDTHFAVAALEQMQELAEMVDRVAPRLSLAQRFTYAQAPLDTRAPALTLAFTDWAAQHARHGQVGRPWFVDEFSEHARLERLEQALRCCTLWLWLDLRFPGVYGHVDTVIALREQLNLAIARQLQGRQPLWQARARR